MEKLCTESVLEGPTCILVPSEGGPVADVGLSMRVPPRGSLIVTAGLPLPVALPTPSTPVVEVRCIQHDVKTLHLGEQLTLGSWVPTETSFWAKHLAAHVQRRRRCDSARGCPRDAKFHLRIQPRICYNIVNVLVAFADQWVAVPFQDFVP
jgi:hypothetical protein